MKSKGHFNTWTIMIAAIVATPIAGALMMASNEKLFNQKEKSRKIFGLGILVTLLFAVPLFLFFNYLPIFLFPLFAGGVWYIVAEVKQGERLKKLPTDSPKASITEIVLHFLPGILAMAAITTGLFLMMNETREQHVEVGSLKHEVRFYGNDKEKAQKVATMLDEAGHFGQAFQTFVYIKAQNDTIVILFPVDHSDWQSREWNDYSNSLKEKLNAASDAPLVLKVFDEKDDQYLEKAF